MGGLARRVKPARLSPSSLVYLAKMLTVNIHEAKTQLSRLIALALKGEPFLIAKAGTPLVKVSALDAPRTPKRLGFLSGHVKVPKDFNTMGSAKIAAQFSAERP